MWVHQQSRAMCACHGWPAENVRRATIIACATTNSKKNQNTPLGVYEASQQGGWPVHYHASPPCLMHVVLSVSPPPHGLPLCSLTCCAHSSLT